MDDYFRCLSIFLFAKVNAHKRLLFRDNHCQLSLIYTQSSIVKKYFNNALDSPNTIEHQSYWYRRYGTNGGPNGGRWRPLNCGVVVSWQYDLHLYCL